MTNGAMTCGQPPARGAHNISLAGQKKETQTS
jgi:hypothetical protein